MEESQDISVNEKGSFPLSFLHCEIRTRQTRSTRKPGAPGFAVTPKNIRPVELFLRRPEPFVDDEPDYVARARAGDVKAFEHLYRSHVGRVYAVCLRLTADPVRASELTQDAFVRAWERLESFRGDSAFSSWLHRLTVNVVLVAFRSQRRRTARIHTTDMPEQYDSPGTGLPDAGLDLEQAIAGLPAQARMVFVLHEVEGYGHAEIAELMEVAPGTSKAQLHRARKLLKKALQR